MNPSRQRAYLYCRISKDAAQEGLGVDRQETACRALCEQRGYEVVDVFTDNDIGAAGAKRHRPAYEAMLESIRDGKADVIVAYSNSRLTRRPSEWIDLITLANAGKLKIATVASGQHDLTTADGRAVAMTIAVWDAAEAERIGERNTAQKAQRAAMGLPMGTRYRVFGYNRDWTVHETEAAVVKDVFKRAVAGESQNSITRHLQASGVRTTAGSEWSVRATTRLLTNEGYAGVYVFKGERIGSTNYPALVDEATFTAANANRTTSAIGHNTRKYLLSNILVCDLCKAPMVGHTDKNKGFRYRCSTQGGGCGRTTIKSQWVDDLINRYMAFVVWRNYMKVKDEPVETESNEVSLEVIDKRIEALHAAEKAGEIDLQDLMRLLRETRKDRAALVASQSTAVERTHLDEVDDYDALDLAAKRTMIKRYFEYVFVRPYLGQKAFDIRRIYVLMTQAWADQTDFDHEYLTLPGVAIDITDQYYRREPLEPASVVN